MKIYRVSKIFLLLGAAVLLWQSCSSANSDGSETVESPGDLKVLAVTTSIWEDIVSNLACGNDTEIKSIIPALSDPHQFTPTASQRSLLEDADLIIANGGRLEEGLEDTLNSLNDNKIFEISDFVPEGDSHFFRDPLLVKDVILPKIAETLEDLSIKTCLDEYSTQLEDIDQQIQDIFEAIPSTQRLIITDHDNLSRFADRYDLTVVGSITPSTSTLSQANLRSINELKNESLRLGARLVLGELGEDEDEIKDFADEINGTYAIIHGDSLGGGGQGASSYLEMLLYDARKIAEGLG